MTPHGAHGMDVRLTHDIEEFSRAAGPFLRAEPFTANVISVELAGVLQRSRPLRERSTWIVAEEAGSVVGAAMQTPPHNLFLPRLGDGVPEAIAETLLRDQRSVPGVSGESNTVRRFVAAWQDGGGPEPFFRVSMRMYVLGTLRPPVDVPGRGSLAVAADADLVTDWLCAFHEEAMPESPAEDFGAMARRRIAGGHVWMWEDDHDCVSLAGVSPPAVGVARVGPVYTPPERRRCGYAAAVTATASRAALDGGATYVVLYTDLANPTSNAVYQAIGYEPDHDAVELDFAPA